MNMCEYMNNLASLDVITKQIIKREIFSIQFDEHVYFSHYTIFDHGGFTRTHSYKFRVEKEGHKPLYKILRKHISNEELVDEYIMKFGILPIAIEIGFNYNMDIFVKEAFYPGLFSEKLNKHKNKEFFLRLR